MATTLRYRGMRDGACVFVVIAADGSEERLEVPAGEQRDVFPGSGTVGVRLAVD